MFCWLFGAVFFCSVVFFRSTQLLEHLVYYDFVGIWQTSRWAQQPVKNTNRGTCHLHTPFALSASLHCVWVWCNFLVAFVYHTSNQLQSDIYYLLTANFGWCNHPKRLRPPNLHCFSFSPGFIQKSIAFLLPVQDLNLVTLHLYFYYPPWNLLLFGRTTRLHVEFVWFASTMWYRL